MPDLSRCSVHLIRCTAVALLLSLLSTVAVCQEDTKPAEPSPEKNEAAAEKKIRDTLEAADQAKADAEAAMATHQGNLETARQESRAIIEEGKRDAEKVKAQIVEDANREAGEISQRATREIELAKESALADLHQQSVDLSIDLAGKLIHKNLSAEDNQALIDETVKGFSDN